MFSEMVEPKNIAKLPEFFDPQFELIANGVTQDYDTFLRGHEKIYQTAITYAVEVEETTVVECGDRIAARVFITTTMPGEAAHEIEVLMIAQLKEGRIRNLWELTRPDWTQVDTFKEHYLES